MFNGRTTALNFTAHGDINNQNLNQVVSDTVMINTPGTVIQARKVFKNLSTVGDLRMADNATVNGIDVSELLYIGVQLAAGQLENVTFTSNVTFMSNVTVTGPVNGVNLSEVVFTDVPAVITAAQSIVGDLTAKNVDVNNSINGYNANSECFFCILIYEKLFSSEYFFTSYQKSTRFLKLRIILTLDF